MQAVLVHGFAQTPASWDGVVRALQGRGLAPEEIVVPPVPSRGSFVACAAELARSVDRPAVWCGYSLGGRLALQLALDHPERVAALVLVSSTAGIVEAEDRARRRETDTALALRAEAIGTRAFVDEWEQLPLFATMPPDAPGAEERRRLPVAAVVHGLVELGTGAMTPLWDRLDELTVPVTVVTGDLDTKFDLVGDALAAELTHAERVRLHGGHALPAEHPRDLAAVVHAVHSAAARNPDSTS